MIPLSAEERQAADRIQLKLAREIHSPDCSCSEALMHSLLRLMTEAEGERDRLAKEVGHYRAVNAKGVQEMVTRASQAEATLARAEQHSRDLEDVLGGKSSAPEDYARACQTIAEMHAAAVGEIRGPIRGVVEDVADLHARAEALQERLAQAEASWRSLDEGAARSAARAESLWEALVFIGAAFELQDDDTDCGITFREAIATARVAKGAQV